MVGTEQSILDALIEEGFVHVPQVISPSVLERMRRRVRQHEGDVTLDPKDGLSYGYALDLSEYLDLAQNAGSLLREMGAKPTVSQIVLVPKKPGELRRNWHTDATTGVINGTSGGPPPSNVMLLYYLEETNEQNGCLLVLPRKDGREAKGPRPMEGEVRVPVKLGDVVLLNPELNHAALANQTDETRLMIRLRFDCEWPHYKETHAK